MGTVSRIPGKTLFSAVRKPNIISCMEKSMMVCGFDDCPCVKELRYKTVAEEMIRGRFQNQIRE